ncbi:GNAT family N-acetyltransferase [Haloplasma contractile]|uniref:Acetyltransferase GNAT family protein n=1 Tax=Haloplasma contractile SSD-17B TaxID=1033810 RepID=U2EAD1_9MOLU|nr:GNAT family N-acetyltransferase [Haloplasma contractile]ERJ11796.1 Acetyltransferase GNAT family protein [Haloplasma contractile SSD-17B]
MNGPAYTIKSKRVLMRCLQPEDAEPLKQAIDESLDHLKRWMKWAKYEPEPLDFKLERIRRYRAKFDLDQQYTYGIFLKDTKKLIGITRLTSKHFNGDFEVGYWIHKDFLNNGYCTEAIQAIVKAAFTINEVERLEIHCDPINTSSKRIPEKLGFMNEGIIRKSELSKDGLREQSMVWSMFIEEYHNSIIKECYIEAYDALNRKLL